MHVLAHAPSTRKMKEDQNVCVDYFVVHKTLVVMLYYAFAPKSSAIHHLISVSYMYRA